MFARRQLTGALSFRDLSVSAALALAAAVIAYAAIAKLGLAGLLAPLGLVLAVIVLLRPRLAVSIAVVLAILCEGPTFGILTFTQHLYSQLYRDISVLDALVALAVLSVAIDVIRSGRHAYIPLPLALPLATLALAMVAGVVTGHAAGAGLRFAIFSEHVLVYMLLLPVAVANLDLDRREVTVALGVVMGLATLKAGLGLVEIAGHRGTEIEGASTLTYYEPTANWVIMGALLVIASAIVTRAKLPRWVFLVSPLLIACLLLSYRRSFWIGAVLGLILILLLGTSAAGRRVLLPATLAIVAAILMLGSVNFQSQLPVFKRVNSLSASTLEANKEDRYRLDERANVLAAIREHPITGLGMTIPWRATARPLPLETGTEGREYVHFAVLWFWMKLGILGLLAYIGFFAGSMTLAWQVWRRRTEPLLRCFGLASLCGLAGLIVIDTTASFTGVDPRLTVVIGAQVGLLAILARRPRAIQEQH